jgi:hypothetical protein
MPRSHWLFLVCISFSVSIASQGELIVPQVGGEMPSVMPSAQSLTTPPLTVSADTVVAASQAALQTSPETRSAPARAKVQLANPGPWGVLEYFTVFLEAPAALLENFPLPNSKPSWTFPAQMVNELPALFQRAGLPQPFADALLLPASQVVDGEWLHLFPSLPDLEGMTPAMRGVVYTELRKHSPNEFHVDPVLILSGDLDQWFAHSKLRPEIIEKMKSYTYMRGECLAFSDLSALLSYSQGEADARAIMKALTRTETLMVKMRLDASTDLPSVLEYWTTGLNLRRKDIEPLMQSIIDVEGADTLGLVHLLPALPRKLLYTYPDPGASRDGILPDCHWTSLNFFNYDAQPYLLDVRLATSAVIERFNPVNEPYKYGDILFFLDIDHGDAFHSCIYIADDIVFTKNGRNLLSPWILMKLSDVKKIYMHDNNGRVQGYRNKKSARAAARAEASK